MTEFPNVAHALGIRHLPIPEHSSEYQARAKQPIGVVYEKSYSIILVILKLIIQRALVSRLMVHAA